MATHQCIKPDCANSYEDDDVDAYYCPSCQAEKAKIAKALDAKLSTRSRREPMSPLKEYENAPKVRGFMQVK